MGLRLLTLLLALTLVLPSGWTSAALWICQGEGVLHAMAPADSAVPDCCKNGCAHPDHQTPGEGARAVDEGCCSELHDADDRLASSDRPDPEPMALMAAPPLAWPVLRSRPILRAASARVGPPSTGPPSWLLHRALLR